MWRTGIVEIFIINTGMQKDVSIFKEQDIK